MRRNLALVRRLVEHPGWFAESVRLFRKRRTHERLWNQETRYEPRDTVTLEEASRALFGREPAAPAVEVPDAAHGAKPELRSFLVTAISAVRPDLVVEVGVARGASSAVILEALQRARRGRLYSIDLPMLTLGDEGVGQLVAEALRDRWDLRLGPSRSLLPKLCAELGSFDIFFHDGDHTEPIQLEDFRVAWPHTKSLFVVDDVCNPGFERFAVEVGREPLVVACKEGFFGAICTTDDQR